MRKRAFVTGVTGQDGHYLTELLLGKGYEVHGLVRRDDASPLPPNVYRHFGDVTDPAAIRRAVEESRPDEVYNLAAQSHVGASFREPTYTWRATAEPIVTILETVRATVPDARVYQASTSEMFGNAPAPQTELTRFAPRSPYAVAKTAAHHTVRMYREAYGIFAVGGILFNHESPRRPPSFVTRKVTMAAAAAAAGKLSSPLRLGNLEAGRDWGFAGDYVEAMWLMLQHHRPDDFVVATGESHTVRELVEAAFRHAGVEDWREHVVIDEGLYRPAEVHHLRGDASKIESELGWSPKTTFDALVRMMVESDRWA